MRRVWRWLTGAERRALALAMGRAIGAEIRATGDDRLAQLDVRPAAAFRRGLTMGFREGGR